MSPCPHFQITSNRNLQPAVVQVRSGRTCANRGAGAPWLTCFSAGSRCYKQPRCQALMGNNGCGSIAAAGRHRWGLEVKVLGSHPLTAPRILGQMQQCNMGKHLEAKWESCRERSKLWAVFLRLFRLWWCETSMFKDRSEGEVCDALVSTVIWCLSINTFTF